MSLTPEQQRAINERAKRDADRAFDTAIQRIKAAGLEPTETLLMAMLYEEFLPQGVSQFKTDIDAGAYSPEDCAQQQSRKKFLGLF